MKTSRGFIALGLILLLVISLAVIGGGGWYVTRYPAISAQQDQYASTTQIIGTGAEDLVVRNILLKRLNDRLSDDSYPDNYITVPAGVVVDPASFAYAGYYMKTTGVFYKDSKYLYWVVFPEPVYDQSFSITRVPSGDPSTFHVISVGSFDADTYAADKNQFYCGPYPFPEINPAKAEVVVKDGYPIVLAGGKQYETTGDSTKPCREVGPKGPGGV